MLLGGDRSSNGFGDTGLDPDWRELLAALDTAEQCNTGIPMQGS